MDYTVEFDSELLKQFPQEEHFMYKEAISHKVTEYLEHNFFRIALSSLLTAKGIYEMKVKINKKNYRILSATYSFLTNITEFIYYKDDYMYKEVSKKIK
ncbi:hypothetical protein [Enterococcus faecium]|uniref:hypothetical protein n=1 Tax=Enterococcus faecium TaxID=1352 RepID=UPI0022028470|nr:hypothetical protein [Enterococcus faecium]BDP46116.1 hypothetical protein EfmJHP9_09860 [Enterococcus faecium]